MAILHRIGVYSAINIWLDGRTPSSTNNTLIKKGISLINLPQDPFLRFAYAFTNDWLFPTTNSIIYQFNIILHT